LCLYIHIHSIYMQTTLKYMHACMQMYLCIQNNCWQHTHIYYVNKLWFWMRLIAIYFCHSPHIYVHTQS